MHIYLLVPPSDPNQYSWGENYAGSSGLMSVSPDMNPMQRARSGTVSLQRTPQSRPPRPHFTALFPFDAPSPQHCRHLINLQASINMQLSFFFFSISSPPHHTLST